MHTLLIDQQQVHTSRLFYQQQPEKSKNAQKLKCIAVSLELIKKKQKRKRMGSLQLDFTYFYSMNTMVYISITSKGRLCSYDTVLRKAVDQQR